MDIQEIFFSQKNFYLLHSLIQSAIKEKFNYDINDEFNKVLLDVMEDVYQNAIEEFPQNITVKDAKKRLNMNALSTVMPHINHILNQKFNPVQTPIQQQPVQQQPVQQQPVQQNSYGLEVETPSLNQEYARLQRERDEEQNIPREMPVFERPTEIEDNEDPEQKYQKLLQTRQYDLYGGEQEEQNTITPIDLQPSNIEETSNLTSLYGNSSMTLTENIQQVEPRKIEQEIKPKENKLQELLETRNYEAPKKQETKLNLKIFKTRLTMNNEFKIPKTKEGYRNLRLLRFLLLDKNEENKYYDSSYYLIKLNEDYEMVIFNSKDNFQYETDNYTHQVEFRHNLNLLQIQIFDDNNEDITNKVNNFYLEVELTE